MAINVDLLKPNGGECLDGVLDSGVALLAEVLECVALDSDPEGNYADDAGPVEHLGAQERKVGGCEDYQRLHHADVLGAFKYIIC